MNKKIKRKIHENNKGSRFAVKNENKKQKLIKKYQ